MLRWWLDEVGDALLFSAIQAALITGGVTAFWSVPTAGVDADPRPSVDAEPSADAPQTAAWTALSTELWASESNEEDAVGAAAVEPQVETESASVIVSRSDSARPPLVGGAVVARRPGSGVAVDATDAAAEVSPPRRACDAPGDPGIIKEGPHQWTVDRSVVQRYTRHLGRLGELGWSRPHDGADGKPDGMLLGGMSCGTDLHDAGFRSGDVIHTVNGRRVTSIPQALWVYGALKGAQEITLEITRKGEPRVLVYRLVG